MSAVYKRYMNMNHARSQGLRLSCTPSGVAEWGVRGKERWEAPKFVLSVVQELQRSTVRGMKW